MPKRATAALILGILALVTGPVTGVPAIILGVRAKRADEGALAYAGLVLGWIGTLWILLLAATFLFAWSKA